MDEDGDEQPWDAGCCGCCGSSDGKKGGLVLRDKQRHTVEAPRYVREFGDVRLRKRFLFRLLMPSCMTIALWILAVRWATSDELELGRRQWLESMVVEGAAEPALPTDWDDEHELFVNLAGHPYVMIASVVLLGLVLLLVMCVRSVVRKTPVNLLLWAMFMLCTAYLLSSVASTYNRAIVMHLLALLLLMLLPIALFCGLSSWCCHGKHELDYWHPVGALWIVMAVAVVGLAVILPHADEYLNDWAWLQDKNAWRLPSHAYSASGVWVTMVLAIGFGFYVLWCIYWIECDTRPDDWLAASITLCLSLWIVFAFSMPFMARACRSSASCVAKRAGVPR